MRFSSHRLRVQEKKIIKKVTFSLILLLTIAILSVFVGLPLFAKGILFLTSFRSDSASSNKTADNNLLFAPSLNPLSEATNSSKITISGFGEPNATVKILVNNEEQAKAVTDSEGNFTALNIKLKEGNNTISAINILDKKDSSMSTPLTILYKKEPPKLDITQPKNGDKFSSDNQEIEITGETEQGAKVMINDRFAIVDSSGKFSFRVKLNPGDNSFKIQTVDIAGNKTEEELKVSYSSD